jgi:superfamily I DNA/RNA helicase
MVWVTRPARECIRQYTGERTFPAWTLAVQSHLDKLNPEQRVAVEATEGPLLILAGAGSGKTRVITSRIAWLIEEKGVAPDSILAVTFTNKAASEMGERVSRLLGHMSLAKPLIATFHSLCVRILRRDIEALQVNGKGLTRTFAIYDENDQQAIVKQVMRRMGLDTKQLTPRTVLGRISWAKNHMVDPEEYYLGSKDPNSERIAHIFKQYKDELRKNNAMDFDDLLLEAARLLKVSSEVRERYQRRWRYLLVDEYQDTNRPQYELMKLLAGEAKNVCAVGDEDQSIYSWRGADIRNILEFEQDFPNARIVRLEQNYRSTQVILEAAGAVVAKNVKRKGKKLWTDRQGGSLIGYYEAPDGENEALFIADRIQKFQREAGEGVEAARCAVLYRTNSQSRLVEEALRRYNIRYTMVGGFSFYERAEIKDLLCYLRLVRNPHDSMAMQRVINTPARGIGKTTLETLERVALETGKSMWEALGAAIENRLIPSRALMALESFRQLLLDAQAMMDPDFAGKLAMDVAADVAGGAEGEDADTEFGFGAAAEETPGTDFSFGGDSNAQLSLLDASHFSPFIAHTQAKVSPQNSKTGGHETKDFAKKATYRIANSGDVKTIEVSVHGGAWKISDSAYEELKKTLEELTFRARGVGGQEPQVEFLNGDPHKIQITIRPLMVDDWKLIAVVHRDEKGNHLETVADEVIPAEYADASMRCEHCNKTRLRNEAYILHSEKSGYQQIANDCLEQIHEGNPRIWHFRDRDARNFQPGAIRELKRVLLELSEAPRFLPSKSEVLRRPIPDFDSDPEEVAADRTKRVEGFRAPGDAATLPELIRFLIDRTGYIKALEAEGSPEAFSRIENLKELANAAHDAETRGETLADFLDHAALASDADQFDPEARVTLMTLHAAKGLEFPLVFLAGLEEGLFPHSRTLNNPDELEEERRLCYVGMTRAMNTLVLTQAHYRRRYGNDAPEQSVPSRFLSEVPSELVEMLGGVGPAWGSSGYGGVGYGGGYGASGYGNGRRQQSGADQGDRHYNYEDESQEIPRSPAGGAVRRGMTGRGSSGKPFVASWMKGPAQPGGAQAGTVKSGGVAQGGAGASGPQPDSIDNIAKFFGGKSGPGRLGSMPRPAMDVPASSGASGLKSGQRVKHAKYGEGTVLVREGEGDDAKLTVLFPRHGLKKLMERFANLQKI